VAARVKDTFLRPAIVCGWHQDGFWKGSGRGIEPCDLGGSIALAKEAGLLMKGGGHRAAAGLAFNEAQHGLLEDWLVKQIGLTPDSYHPEHEILASLNGCQTKTADQLAAKWCELFAMLEPFGAGNPAPNLLLENAELKWGPEPKKKASGDVWAWKAGFSWAGQGYIFADWGSVERAKEWRKGGFYNLVLSVSCSTSGDKKYFNWRVVNCVAE